MSKRGKPSLNWEWHDHSHGKGQSAPDSGQKEIEYQSKVVCGINPTPGSSTGLLNLSNLVKTEMLPFSSACYILESLHLTNTRRSPRCPSTSIGSVLMTSALPCHDHVVSQLRSSLAAATGE